MLDTPVAVMMYLNACGDFEQTFMNYVYIAVIKYWIHIYVDFGQTFMNLEIGTLTRFSKTYNYQDMVIAADAIDVNSRRL